MIVEEDLNPGVEISDDVIDLFAELFFYFLAVEGKIESEVTGIDFTLSVIDFVGLEGGI